MEQYNYRSRFAWKIVNPNIFSYLKFETFLERCFKNYLAHFSLRPQWLFSVK